MTMLSLRYSFFFFNDTATTEIYTLSLHDALPIFRKLGIAQFTLSQHPREFLQEGAVILNRSEEHTSELQSPCNLVCRLLLEKKKKKNITVIYNNNNHITYQSLYCRIHSVGVLHAR